MDQKHTSVVVASMFITCAVGAVWAFSEQQTPAGTAVKASAITVVGQKGEDRIRMRMLDDVPIIEILDDQGRTVASLASKGDSGQLILTGRNGAISLTAQPEPRFSILDSIGRERVMVGLQEGTPIVNVADATSRNRVTLQIEDVAAATPKTRAKLSIRSESPLEAGSATLVPDSAYIVSVDSDGEMSVEAIAQRKQVLKLQVDPEGQPRLDLADDLKAAMRRALGF